MSCRNPFAIFLSAVLIANTVVPAFARYDKPSRSASPAAASVKPKVATNLPLVREQPGVKGTDAVFGKSAMGAAPALPRSGSILDETGAVDSAVTPEHEKAWRTKSDPVSKLRQAEWMLATTHEPRVAEQMLSELIQAPDAKAIRGLAKRAKGFALHFQGRYQQASDYVLSLLKSNERGVDFFALRGFQRHVSACAGYHNQREALGIFEPGRLDPLCGVRSAGKALTRVGVPYDEKKMSKVVRHDGFGSSLKDIVDGIKSLGFNATVMTGRPELARYMPMPAIAHVEHDHFITLLSANESEVRYWCVDCGGDMKVTWKQWEAMDCDAIVSVTKPGSTEDIQLAMVVGEQEKAVLASLNATNPFLPLAKYGKKVDLLSFLMLAICGYLQQGLHHCDCQAPFAGLGNDPVNLANGEEQFSPGPDLVVNNPIGPDVSWSRSYNTYARTLENGFGHQWTHNYNIIVATNELVAIDWTLGMEVQDPGFEIVTPNTGTISFTLPPGGASSHVGTAYPSIELIPAHPSEQVRLTWKWDEAAQSDYFVMTFADGHTIQTTTKAPMFSAQDPRYSWKYAERIYRIAKQTDSLGNFITFHYNSSTRVMPRHPYYDEDLNVTIDSWSYPVTNLTSIKDSNGNSLLTLGVAGSTAMYTSATAADDRKVIYNSTYLPNSNMNSDTILGFYGVTTVSQIVESNATSGGMAERYDYSLIGNGVGNGSSTGELAQALTAISVPNPSSTAAFNPIATGLSTTRIVYDAFEGVTLVTDGNGNRMEIDYALPPNGQPASVTNRSNKTTVTLKNAAGTVQKVYSYLFNDEMSWTELQDKDGNPVTQRGFGGISRTTPTWVKDGEGHEWTNNLVLQNGNVHLVSSTTPRNVTTTRTYANASFPNDKLIEVKEGSKASTTYEYYTNGLLKKVNSPIPGEVGQTGKQTTEIFYDGTLGNITRVETPGRTAGTKHIVKANYTTDGTYSQSAKQGQPLVVKRAYINGSNVEVDIPDGQVHLRYDGLGRVTDQTDALGFTTNTTYNLASQVLTTLAPPSQPGNGRVKSESVYQYVGGPLSQANTYGENNVLARQVNITYGPGGETLSQTGSTEDVSYTYNSFGQPLTLKDGNNNTTTYMYDLNGRATSVLMPGATSGDYDKVQFLSYNNSGKLLTKKDGRGITSTYNYGEVDGGLTSLTYSTGGTGSITLGYDSYGRNTTITDPTGTSSSGFDDLGNMLTSTRTYTGVTPQAFNYTYTYDGLRQTMVNSGGTWSYSYDQLGRYTSMSSPLGTVTSAWDLNSRQTQRTLPSGAFTTYGYNQLGTITSLVNQQNANTTLSNFNTFSFDPVFNIKQWTQSVTPPNAGSNASQFAGVTGYEYNGDALGTTNKDQLTKETSTRFAAPGSPWTENNVYDDAGNPTTFRNTAGQVFNANNQKTGSTFAYDGNGNPTTYQGKTATYDTENRLTKFPNVAGGDWKAGYRADGLRAWVVASSVTTGGLEAQTEKVYYYYDGGNAVLEVSASGNLVSTNVFAPDGLVARSYTPPQLTPIGEGEEEVEVMLGTSYVGEYLFDWQGNATHILTPAAVQVGGQPTNYTLIHSAYNAWGQKNFLYPANVNMELHRFGYNARWGYRTDTETGLMYCQNRYYDAANGRWLTRDPISYSGGVNLYGYCGNGPVGNADPEGLVAPLVYLAGTLILTTLLGGGVAHAPSYTDTPQDFDRSRERALNGKAEMMENVLMSIVPCEVLLGWIGKGAKALKGRRLAKGGEEALEKIVGKPGWKGNKNPASRPNPAAEGPHSNFFKKKSSRGKKEEYTQGYTFDKDGNFVGRTDNTYHDDPLTHPWTNPVTGGPSHFHPWGGPGIGWGGGPGPLP